MDAIEKAIRGAFERGDAEDPAYREKVYRSVSAALEKAILASPDVAEETSERRRAGLRATIEMVETEFRPAMLPESRGAVEPTSEEARSPAAHAQPEPELSAPVADPEYRGRAPLVPSVDDFDRAPSRMDERLVAAEPLAGRIEPRRRGRFAAAFLVVTLLAALGIGGWVAVEMGLLKSAAERDTSVPNPPLTIAEEEFQPPEEPLSEPLPAGAAEQRENWIPVFSPADPTTVRVPGEASAGVVEDGPRPALRIRSGSDDTAVVFEVGEGLLAQLRGKTATFDISARAEPGQPTQMSVICNFGELGDCGRKRYAVGEAEGEFLFEVTMPDTEPGSDGAIAIVSDLENAGKAVDVFEIRVSPSD